MAPAPTKKKRRWLVSRPDVLAAAFFRLLVPSFALYFLWTFDLKTHLPWFEDIREPVPLVGGDQEAMMSELVAAVYGTGTSMPRFKRLGAESSPRVVFLSVSDGVSAAHVSVGRGDGLRQALQRAISESRKPGTWVARPKWVKLDVVQEVAQQTLQGPGDLVLVEPGVDGIAFDRTISVALLPEELSACGLFGSRRGVRLSDVERCLNERPDSRATEPRERRGETLTLFRFNTLSFFSDGERVVQMTRGRVVTTPLDSTTVESSLKWATEYLRQAVTRNGRFVGLAIGSDYLMEAHAESLLALLHLLEWRKEENTAIAIENAGVHLDETLKSCEGITEPCMRRGPKAELSLRSLAALAFSRPVWAARHKPRLEKLGKWILANLPPSPAWEYDSTLDSVAADAAGQAVLALLRLEAALGGGKYAAGAERAARFLINERDRRIADAALPADRWWLEALGELYRRKNDPALVEHAQRIAGGILGTQNRSPIFPEWKGSFFEPPRSAETARRTAVLCRTYLLVKQAGRNEVAERLQEGIRLGVAFQLRTQFVPQNVLYLAQPDRVLGGFHRNLTDFEVKLDFVTRNVDSLLCFRQMQ